MPNLKLRRKSFPRLRGSDGKGVIIPRLEESGEQRTACAVDLPG